MKTTRRTAAAVAAGGIALLCTTALSGSASADSARTVGQEGARAAAAQSITWVHVWATGVNVRDSTSGPNCNAYPSASNCPGIVRTVSQQDIGVYCQKRGQPISDSGYSSEWWSYTYNGPKASGWTSNVYISGKAHLDGVPDCTF